MKLSTVSRAKRVNVLMTTCLAICAMVSVAACSSSKGGGPNRPGGQPTVAPSPSPAPYKYDGRSELDKGSGKSSQDDLGQPDGDPSFTGTPDDSASDGDSTPQPVPVPLSSRPRTGTRRDSRGSVTPVQTGPTQPAAYSPAMVDGNGTPMYYSSASSDNLRSQIEAIAPATAGDVAWATELSKGKLRFTKSTGAVEVNILQTLKNGDQYKITLRGVVAQSGRGRLPDTGSGISAYIECLDLDLGCETAHLRVFNAAYSPTREAHMIIRTTNSKLDTRGRGFDISHNHEYDWFMNILVNSATRKTTFGYVDRLIVASSETMHGQSNIAVDMDILNQDRIEHLDFFGPLVRYADRSAVNVPMTQSSVNPAGWSQLISNSLARIRMVGNNGRGEVKMALTVRAANAGSVEDTMTLTLNRIENAIKSPTSL